MRLGTCCSLGLYYKGADKSLARPTSGCILSDGENIPFDASLVIQGDSGGICNTLGNNSMCDSMQKSSYEHGSDFGRLRSYDRLKLRIEGNDY